MVAEHYARAATLGADADLEPGELERDRGAGARGARGGRRRGRGALLEQRGARATTRRRSRSTARHRPEAAGRGSARSSATSRCASGRVDRAVERLGALPGVPPRRGGPGPGRRPAPQDRRRALAQGRPRGLDRALPARHRPAQGRPARASSSSASTRRPPRSTCTPATTCSRSTPRRRRCGWPSGSARPAAASRAHGIFGRVFGRIGDSERARENLERSVELARETDPAEAVRALLALGYHLEVSEADYDAAADAYSEALDLALRDRRPALAGRAARRARPGRGLPRRVGRGRARDRGLAGARRARGPDRQALLPVLDARRAALARRRPRRRRRTLLERAFEMAEQVGRSEVAFESLHVARDRARATAATTPTPTRRSPGRSTSASAPASSPSRSRRPPPAPSTLALWGKAETAARLAEEAAGLAERLRYPVGQAASLEARGATAADPAERARLLDRGARGMGAPRPPARRRALHGTPGQRL